MGKSSIFLIEANPSVDGRPAGVHVLRGRGSAKQSAGGAAIIHFPAVSMRSTSRNADEPIV